MSSEVRDIQTVMWKETKELIASSGSQRGGLRLLLAVLVLVILLPLQNSGAWFTSPLAIFFDSFFLPFGLLVSTAANTFAGERERHTLETLLASRLSDRAILLGKVLTLTLTGWCLSVLAAVLQIGVVDLALDFRHLAGPRVYGLATATSIVVLSLLLSLLVTVAGSAVSLRSASVQQAQQLLTVAFVVLAIVPVLGFQALASQRHVNAAQWFTGLASTPLLLGGSLLLAVVDVGIVVALLVTFRRSRLLV
jgi:ABC-2 type transport system permease protein